MCNDILSFLINNKKLHWLRKIPDKYFLYTVILLLVIFIIFSNFISLFDIVGKKIAISIFFIIFSLISFFYGVGALHRVPGNISQKTLCWTSFVQIFGAIPFSLFAIFIVLFY